ncbi:MAG TPA: hypothetical protein VFD39_07290 [Trueperaceae bacterium]|nr:hypothetical protein [Trueperaceae bacterium]
MLQPDLRLGDPPEAVAMLVHPLERVRTYIGAALEAAGWRVICVASSAEAMVRARDAHPSVAVIAAGIECLDDGRHPAVALRHTPDTGPRPRIVLVASAHDERVAALAKAAGGAQVILEDRPIAEPEPTRTLWVIDDNTATRRDTQGDKRRRRRAGFGQGSQGAAQLLGTLAGPRVHARLPGRTSGVSGTACASSTPSQRRTSVTASGWFGYVSSRPSPSGSSEGSGA